MGPERYDMTWQFVIPEVYTIDDVIAALEIATTEMRAMKDAGVVLRKGSSVPAGCVRLTTFNYDVADRFGFEQVFAVDDEREDESHWPDE